MKTTSSSVLAKKIEVLVTARVICRRSFVYECLADLKSNDILRPVFTTGITWNYSTLHDKSKELITILKLLNIDFTIGNDAPKGGKTGYFIKILTKINQAK